MCINFNNFITCIHLTGQRRNLNEGLKDGPSSSGTDEPDAIGMEFSLYVFDPPCSPDISQVHNSLFTDVYFFVRYWAIAGMKYDNERGAQEKIECVLFFSRTPHSSMCFTPAQSPSILQKK